MESWVRRRIFLWREQVEPSSRSLAMASEHGLRQHTSVHSHVWTVIAEGLVSPEPAHT